jgi:PAS domain S-box-containing protein
MRSAVLHLVMRDEHRPKQELVHEMTGLRKQVLDLKDAMTARRRVEDALRAAMAVLHTLIDNAPAGLCLFRRDGTLLTANRPFARMLGYESAAELQRVGGVLGVFASPEEQARMLGSARSGPPGALFRHKAGTHSCLEVMAAACDDHDYAVLVVFEQLSPSHPSPLTGA